MRARCREGSHRWNYYIRDRLEDTANSHDPTETTAEKVMSSEILYCRDTDEADDVTKNMGENKVRRPAVLDSNKRLVGIVTLGDLASHTNYTLCGECWEKSVVPRVDGLGNCPRRHERLHPQR